MNFYELPVTRTATYGNVNRVVDDLAGRWTDITAQGVGVSLRRVGHRDFAIGTDHYTSPVDALRAYKRRAGKTIYRVYYA